MAPISETIAVQGKLEPASSVKEVKSPVDGQVELVLVKEGETVKQGQPLVRFDLRQARSRLAAAESIRQRLLNENSVARATLGEEAARADLTPNQLRQLDDRGRELQSRLASARQELRKSETRLAGFRESLATYANIASRYEQLASTGAVSELQLLEARNKAQELRSRVAEEEEEISRLRSQIVNTGSGTDVELRTTIESNLRQISELEGQIREAKLQIQFSTLQAPSAGKVFDLSVTRGSVVVAADPKPILKWCPRTISRPASTSPTAASASCGRARRPRSPSTPSPPVNTAISRRRCCASAPTPSPRRSRRRFSAPRPRVSTFPPSSSSSARAFPSPPAVFPCRPACRSRPICSCASAG